ncbi:MAG TPA: PD-(D/E)XK nuclease family protein, partial [Nitrososphaeraceae archaeon]|nr:PD-(D/E)XK nuclease family protein [Nitrososphaeraceae archaeon]
KKIRTIELPKINYKEGQKQVSYSQFSTYLKCPFQWYLTYGLKKYEDKPSIHTVFGTALHETLQYYFSKMYTESGAAADREDIVSMFERKIINEYQDAKKKQNDEHFSTAEELREFNEDGQNILNWFKKHRNEYFTTRNCRLLGIEMPLIVEVQKNLFFKGLLDIVLYDIDIDRVFIIDFKTSTRGWKDQDKKDEIKISQIILYKKYFSELYGMDPDKIEVEFIILKRKIWEESEFPQSRIQVFSPTSGKTTRNKVSKKFEDFLKECYDSEGNLIINKEFEKKPSEWNCRFCSYANQLNICNKLNNIL